MAIPFIQHTAAGVDIVGDTLYYVSLSRIGNHVFMKDFQTFDTSKANNLAEALNSFFVEYGKKNELIAISIPTDKIRSKNFSVPVFEYEEDYERWKSQKMAGILPNGIGADQFMMRVGKTETKDEQYYNSFFYTHSNTVESLGKLTLKNGNRISGLFPGDVVKGYSFLFDDEFVQDNTAILSIGKNLCSLSLYRGSAFICSKHLKSSWNEPDLLAQELESGLLDLESQTKIDSPVHTIYLAGHVNEEYKLGLEKELTFIQSKRTLRFIRPLHGLKSKEPLPPQAITAGGNAVRNLFKDWDNYNFIPEQLEVEISEFRDRKDAMSLISKLGAAVFILILLLFILQSYMNELEQESRLHVNELQEQINHIENTRAELLEMRSQIKKAGSLVNKRTRVARDLERLGRAIPKKLWFNTLAFRKDNGEKKINVSGYAENDLTIARYLDNLEGDSLNQDIRLDYSESVSIEEPSPKKLVEFQITMKAGH